MNMACLKENNLTSSEKQILSSSISFSIVIIITKRFCLIIEMKERRSLAVKPLTYNAWKKKSKLNEKVKKILYFTQYFIKLYFSKKKPGR